MEAQSTKIIFVIPSLGPRGMERVMSEIIKNLSANYKDVECPGYWDSTLAWHEGQFNPQEWIVEGIINYSKTIS